MIRQAHSVLKTEAGLRLQRADSKASNPFLTLIERRTMVTEHSPAPMSLTRKRVGGIALGFQMAQAETGTSAEIILRVLCELSVRTPFSIGFET